MITQQINTLLTRGHIFGHKVGQICIKLDKFGTFEDLFFVPFGGNLTHFVAKSGIRGKQRVYLLCDHISHLREHRSLAELGQR